MPSNPKKATSIDVKIILDLKDSPDTSMLMNELHKKGYAPNSIKVNLPKVEFQGQYGGSVSELIDIMSKILSLKEISS